MRVYLGEMLEDGGSKKDPKSRKKPMGTGELTNLVSSANYDRPNVERGDGVKLLGS